MKRKSQNKSENKCKKSKMDEFDTILDGDVQEFFKLPNFDELVRQNISKEKLWTKLQLWINQALLKILEDDKGNSDKIIKNCLNVIKILLESVDENFSVSYFGVMRVTDFLNLIFNL